MPTRNVVLTQHHEDVIEGLVSSGRYQNASEVLREGVRLVEQRENLEKAKLEALKAAVQVGLDDIEAGRFTEVSSEEEFEVFMANIDREVASRLKRV